VSHGPRGWYAVYDAGEDVGGTGAACDYRRLGSIYGSPRSMRPSGTEFTDRMGGGAAYSGCLGGHCHLVVHDAEHRCLQNLGLDERCFHDDYRFVRKGDFAFSHRVDIAGELHAGKVMPELRVLISRKEFLIELLRHGTEVFYHFHHFIGSADYSPVVVFRRFPVKQVEHRHLLSFSTVHE